MNIEVINQIEKLKSKEIFDLQISLLEMQKNSEPYNSLFIAQEMLNQLI